MGQKVHPIGFRVGISRGWESVWFAEKREYTQFLHEDIKIRKFLKEKLKEAGISRIEIRRRVPATDVEIEIHASKPGVIYGRKSKGLEILNEDLKKFISGEPRLFIIQIRKADLQAQLVAESVAQQLEKRVSFRRAMKKSIQQTMRAGALGIKVSCSGRLGGADMSRCEWFREGRVPLHTLRADIDYGFCIAMTTYGVIGVKVWIYKGEVGESEEE